MVNKCRHSFIPSLLLIVALVTIGDVGVVLAQAGAAPKQGKTGAAQLDRQKAAQSVNTDFLKQFNNSLQALARKVSPAVVQILVTGFGPVEDESGASNAALIGRQASLGSGVMVDPDGYIITNAHVVAGAQTIRVVLNSTQEESEASEEGPATKEYEARVVGVHSDTDLALLKVDAKGLPFLPIASERAVRQGELVIALGSPEGLQNSVTMGVVSSVDRQADPSRAMVYIQTDAPINRGNSGGPLVDVDGYLIGINTFILSASGGSEGLGFAIPARIVSFVYDRLKRFGHVDRSQIGASAIAITPVLAAGLKLPANSGVMISDVLPGGPADTAGMRIQDIVVGIDGRPIRSLPMLNTSLYLHPTSEVMAVEVLRGSQRVTLHVPVMAQKHDVDRLANAVDPEKNLVGRLNIIALTLTEDIAKSMPDLRVASGVVVVANTTFGRGLSTALKPGDIIHSVNNEPITSLEQLRSVIDAIKPGHAVVIQVEHEGTFDFVAFETE